MPSECGGRFRLSSNLGYCLPGRSVVWKFANITVRFEDSSRRQEHELMLLSTMEFEQDSHRHVEKGNVLTCHGDDLVIGTNTADAFVAELDTTLELKIC